MWKKSSRKSKEDSWWSNEEEKEAISRIKVAHKVMCRHGTQENKNIYKKLNDEARKAVSKSMREKVEVVLTELKYCPNGMLRILKGLMVDSKEVEGARCM